jgi:hypothetical protein
MLLEVEHLSEGVAEPFEAVAYGSRFEDAPT